MADNEPRKRKKRRSQGRNDNPRTDSESEKGAVRNLNKDSKKSKKPPKFRPQDVEVSENNSSGSCIKCMFFLLISSLVIGVGLVAFSFQFTESPAVFTDDVIETINTFISDIKPDSTPSPAENKPIVSESEMWHDGSKVEASDELSEKLLHESELEDTYGIHLGRPPSSQMQMDDFPELSSDPVIEDSIDIPDLSSRQTQSSPDLHIHSSDSYSAPVVDEVPQPMSEAPAPVETQVPDTPVDVPKQVVEAPVETQEPVQEVPAVNVNEEVVPEMPADNSKPDIDVLIQRELDNADGVFDESPDQALELYLQILKHHKNNAQATFGVAKCYDQLSSRHKSNTYVEKAIASYVDVIMMDDSPIDLFITSADRAADLSIFRGMYSKAVAIQRKHINKTPLNITVLNKLAVSYLMVGQDKEAEKVLNEVLKIDGNNGFAKVHLGFILKTHYLNYKDAVKYLSEGILTREPGTIDGRFFYHLGDAYIRLGLPQEAKKVHDNGAKEGVFLSSDQRSLYNVNNLNSKPWWDFSNTRYREHIKLLESNWKIIKEEAIALLNKQANNFAPESEDLQDTGDWRQFEMFARGRINSRNCKLAPKTCDLALNIPDAVRCTRCQTKFSIMYPGTHVWPHTGPTNCRLRAHLGLVVPAGPKIRVANQTRNWDEGKVIIFDDSFEHEVWHTGNSYRLVLIIDFWHPDLTDEQKSSLSPI